jgi:dTMP kinase
MKIIAYEGIDACGKETQSKLLAAWLRKNGFKTAYSGFPRYESPIGNVIRKWLDGQFELSAEAVQMLYDADRQDFTLKIEQLEAEDFDFLVLDRYTLSNLAFGRAKGIDYLWMKALQAKTRKADMTVFIDIKPATSFERRGEGRDRNERDVELLRSARNEYLNLALTLDGTYIVNGEDSIDEVQEHTRKLVQNHFLL